MTLDNFTSIVEGSPRGIVLLEGRRTISEQDAACAALVARTLARRFAKLRFRSGNAKGSDEAFSEGVIQVDPSRLQIVAPYANHRKGCRHKGAVYDSPESLSRVQEDEIAYKTAIATPKNERLIRKRHDKTALAAKASYLIRDTMKVVGHSDKFPRPVCALFFVDPDDPLAGGTGHTIRVCRQEGVPVAFQDSWHQWFTESSASKARG